MVLSLVFDLQNLLRLPVASTAAAWAERPRIKIYLVQ